MRPLLRSYGDRETVTVSPGRMRMKFLRILPAMWAMISCPLSSRTLNWVLARAATTFPCTWIDSSLAMLLLSDENLDRFTKRYDPNTAKAVPGPGFPVGIRGHDSGCARVSPGRFGCYEPALAGASDCRFWAIVLSNTF